MMRLDIRSTWDGTPVGVDERVVVDARLDGRCLRLVIDAPYHGDPAPHGPPGPTDRLWEHEVVELFVAGEGHPVPYTEIEVGPHGHHLVLRLRGVRAPEATLLPLELSVSRAAGRWHAEACLDRALLPPGPHRANAFAIHGVGQARRHLAATPLPGPRPDFHQPRRFLAADLEC